MNTTTINERNTNEENALINKFVRALSNSNVETKRAIARRIVTIFKNDTRANVVAIVNIARTVLRDAR